MSRGPPRTPPIGLQLSRTARVASLAFERELRAAGGSLPTWQVLVLVRSRQWGTQSQLAEAIGVTGATLTHHLNALETQGLIRRWRETDDRRVQQVELTAEGVALFDRLRAAAASHDARLRSQLTAGETAQLADLLDRLRAGIGESS